MLFAGPCAIESREQGFRIAKFVKECGATHFRAGCWKGQNRPFPNGKPAYWGMKLDGAVLLREIQKELDIACISEAQSIIQAEFLINNCHMKWIQVGARHMQNFPLLQYLADKDVTVVLKRGLGNTVDEWIGAAEHLGGPDKVILCERGIATFDRTEKTRWRLDFVGVAHIKRYSDYRVIIDPSHGSGDRELVPSLSRAALAIADGLMIEVRYEPQNSPTDANQTIDFETFKKIASLYAEKCKKD